LEQANLQLRVELQAAEIRRELAENLPRLAKLALGLGKKTTEPTTERRRSRSKRPQK
jgi:hypothetical protein